MSLIITKSLSRSMVFQGRTLSTAVNAELKRGDENEQKVYIKKLKNGMIVGSIENNAPVARLAMNAKAGSRFETGENLGLAHCLRHSAKMRTENMSSLGIVRSSTQLGSNVMCQGTREYVSYKCGVTRNCVGKMVEILHELTTRHVFKPWEVADLQNDPNGIKLDLAVLKKCPEIRLMEGLHSAAFRDTLGRSLYAPDFMVGKYNPEQLMHYVKTFFSAGRIALVGVGVNQNELEDMAEKFEPYAAAGVPDEKATYHGGEVRENVGGELSYVAFTYSGPSQNSKDLLPSEVLRHILGVGPSIKYSSGTSISQLAKAVSQATDAPFAVKCVNANYSDAGLFGFTVVAPQSQIDQIIRTASQQFRLVLTNGVSDTDVSRAKYQLKAEISMMFEDPDSLLKWLGEQSLNSDQTITPQEVFKMVDNITTTDVNNAAKKIAATKPSMSVTGNVSSVPYLDQLVS